MRYRPEIDGLRAVAVALVLVFHFGLMSGVPQLLAGGFVGVDVFFVLSGYLVTSLIWRHLRAGTFTLRSFFGRRIRRLLPASLVMTLAVLCVAPWYMTKGELLDLLTAVRWQTGFAANIHYWQTSGYFGMDAIQQPLLHTWSLAVEEQFYLILPLILVVLRNRSRWFVIAVLSGLAAWSFRFNVSCFETAPYAKSTAYLLLTSRAWEMLAGAVIALLPPVSFSSERLRRIVSTFAAGLGIWAIGYAAVTLHQQSHFPGWAAVYPVAGTSVLLLFGLDVGLLKSLLSWSPVVWIGRRSYSLYLWHWPVICISIALFDPAIAPWVALGVTAITIAGHHLVGVRENPTLPRPHLAILATGFGVLLACLVTWAPKPSAVVATCPQYGVTADRIDRDDVPEIGDADGPLTFVLWGDSHMMGWLPAFDVWLKTHGQRAAVIVYAGTAPVIDLVDYGYGLGEDAPAWADAAIRYCARLQVPNIVMASHWNIQSAAQVPVTLERIKSVTDAHCYVCMAVPTFPCDVERAYHHGQTPWMARDVGDCRHQPRTEKVLALGATILDPRGGFLDANHTGYVAVKRAAPGRDVVLMEDDNHISRDGSLLVCLPVLEQQLPGGGYSGSDRSDDVLTN